MLALAALGASRECRDHRLRCRHARELVGQNGPDQTGPFLIGAGLYGSET